MRDGKRMRLLVFFFSGTGKTQFVGEYLEDRGLESCPDKPVDVTLAAIEWTLPDAVVDQDLVCIGLAATKVVLPETCATTLNGFRK
jgi:hypothetical protein